MKGAGRIRRELGLGNPRENACSRDFEVTISHVFTSDRKRVHAWLLNGIPPHWSRRGDFIPTWPAFHPAEVMAVDDLLALFRTRSENRTLPPSRQDPHRAGCDELSSASAVDKEAPAHRACSEHQLYAGTSILTQSGHTAVHRATKSSSLNGFTSAPDSTTSGPIGHKLRHTRL